MAFQVSPGVVTREIDLTNVIPAVSTSIGATVVAGLWGPAEEIVTITNEKELVDTFGVPVDATAAYFFNAAAFLKYGNNLKVSRIIASGALNATSGTTSAGTGLLIKNRADYEDNYSSFEAADTVGTFTAKFPGTFGNLLRVSFVTNTASFNGWDAAVGYTVEDQFTGAPGTSAYAASKGGSADEMHFVVIDETGYITGTKGTIIEKFEGLSQAKDAKNFDGSSNYYKDVINTQSKYVWVTNAPTGLTYIGGESSTDFTTADTAYNRVLAGGSNGGTIDAGDIDTAFQVFNDAETVDVNLLIGAPTLGTGTDYEDGVTQANNLLAIAENRKDVVAFISPPMEATVGAGSDAKNNVLTFADQLTSSSYGFLDSTSLKVYDKYNDVYRWIPAAGHMAGLCANTDEVADPWFPPAGYTRGQILGITKVAFNPKKAERDDLYKKRVNPIVSFPGEGTILFGDKTLQAKPSAFDRINVRRLFIILEKAIATAAKYQLFELNDEFTRAMFRNMTEPFLREIKGRRGVTDFKVVCDETNNTGEIIDSNQFVADIYIKPARSINFINLNFIATRTGVDFSEIGG